MNTNSNYFQELVDILRRMLSFETAKEFSPPCSSASRAQNIAANLIEWLTAIDRTKKIRPLKLDLTRPFGREVIQIAKENCVLSEVLSVEGAMLSIANRLSTEQQLALASEIHAQFPPQQETPMWR